MGIYSSFYGTQKILNFLFIETITILFAIVLLIFIPLLLVILSPVFIIRRIVNHLSRYLRSDLGKLVTTLGSIMVHDDVYRKPTLNVVVGLTFEGNISAMTLKECFEKNAIGKYLPNKELKYPELQQIPTPWCGFMFWKNDEKFNILNHIKELDNDDTLNPNKSYEEIDIKNLAKIMVEQPWIKNRPWWEVILVKNYFPNEAKDIPHSIVFFRFHHTLGDGYSILSMLICSLANKQINIPRPTHKVIEGSVFSKKFKSCLKAVLIPFTSAYEFSGHLIKLASTMSWKSYWNSKGGVKGEKLTLTLSDKLSLEEIKNIKNEQNVTFTSVLLEIVTGSIRETMIRRGKRVPKYVSCGVVTILPRRDLKLRNLITGSVIHLPIGEPDPVKRLQICNDQYERLKRSSMAILMGYLLIPMTGGLFNSWVKVLARNTVVPIGLSNFPAGLEYPTLEGKKCVDVFFTAGTALNNYGLIFCLISYEESLRISTISTDRLMKPEDMEQFNQYLHNQINLLKSNIIV